MRPRSPASTIPLGRAAVAGALVLAITAPLPCLAQTIGTAHAGSAGIAGIAVERVVRPPAEAYQRDPGYRLAGPEPAVGPVAPVAPVGPASLTDKPFSSEIGVAARAAGVDPALVHAIIAVESAYRPAAVSPKGAIGLMQLMPATAQRHGVADPARVADNLRAGTRHLRALLDRYGMRLDLVLAAYNAGEGAVQKHNNAVPPYPETRSYVPAVLRHYQPAPPPALPEVPVAPAVREYLPGTRLAPDVLDRLP